MSKSMNFGSLMYLPQVYSDQLCCDLLLKNSEKTFPAQKLVVSSSSKDMAVLVMP